MTNPELTLYSVKKIESFSSKIRNKTWLPTLTILIQYSIRSLARTIRQNKEIKDTQIRMEEVQLSLCADDIILYTDNCKDSTKNCWN